MDEPRVTRGTLPSNHDGNDPYDTGIDAQHHLELIEPRGEIETPADLADEVVRQLQAVLKYVPESKQFFGWDGQRFEPDVDHLLIHAISAVGNSGHNRISLKKLRQKRFIEECLWSLRHDPSVRRSIADFDTNAYELNTPNGIINLRTGKRSPHHDPSLVTKLTTTSPREERCDRFHQFLDEITGGDKSLQDYLQVMLGACLSGSPEAHWMAFLHGPTRSGKSVMVELLAHIMGSYAHTTDGSLFRKNSNDAELTQSYMRLWVNGSSYGEVDHGHFDDIMIKQLTGGLTSRHGRYIRTWSFPAP